MKKLFILSLMALFLSPLCPFGQEVGTVTISTSASIGEVLDACQKAGAEEKYGSRDRDEQTGTLTLWKRVGTFASFEFFAYVKASFNNGVTTFKIDIPKHPRWLSDYKKEVKKIARHLELPNMMFGEYSIEIR